MSKSGFIRTLSIFALALLLPISLLQADNMYKWVDQDGRVHYTNKRPNEEAKPHKLPPINRGDWKLAKIKVVSCEKHGGVDCGAGADADGSVICYDGFKGSSIRYRFSCSSPKLEISTVSEISPEGTFTVFVRNKKSVPAQKPSLYYKPEFGPEVKLEGPEEIEAFGMAEFNFTPRDEKNIPQSVTIAALNLTCTNCP